MRWLFSMEYLLQRTLTWRIRYNFDENYESSLRNVPLSIFPIIINFILFIYFFASVSLTFVCSTLLIAVLCH